MRSGALTHAVQLVQRNIQAEEELQGVFGDGSGARVALTAAVQPKSLAHLSEHQLFGYVVAERCTACRAASEERRKTTSAECLENFYDEIQSLQRMNPLALALAPPRGVNF